MNERINFKKWDTKTHKYGNLSKPIQGHKMNHATARNIFLRAMKKLAEPLCELYEMESDPKRLDELSRNPSFQSSMIEVVSDIYSEQATSRKSPSVKIDI